MEVETNPNEPDRLIGLQRKVECHRPGIFLVLLIVDCFFFSAFRWLIFLNVTLVILLGLN